MTDDLRSLREHLADPRLYDQASRPPASGAWRGALLARLPLIADDRRPLSRATELRQLLLRIALPLALAVAATLLVLFKVPLSLPSLPGASPSLPPYLAEAARFLPSGPLLWLSLGGLSTLLTFLVRGHVPRLLPGDW